MIATNTSGNVKLRIGIFISLSILIAGAGLLWWYGYFEQSKGPIGDYRPKDRSAILKLLKDDWYWLVAEGAVDFSPDYMLDHHAATYHYADNTLAIKVYRTRKGQVAGFVTYHLIEAYRGRIQFLAVAPEFRKKGYARDLMQYAINGLKKQGCCLIDIAVRSNNIPAFNLYKKFGFEETWSTPDGFLGMTKSLCTGLQTTAVPASADF